MGLSARSFSQAKTNFDPATPVSYLGAFSSVSTIDEEGAGVFHDSLTAYANYVYDSVIRADVKAATPVNALALLPVPTLQLLTGQITQNMLQYSRTALLDSVKPSPLLDSVASLYPGRYASCFISYGRLWSKKQNRQYIAGKVFAVSVVIIGFTVLAVLSAATQADLITDGLLDKRFFGKEDPPGMYCYYMVYDKQDRRVCYMRKAFFTSEKSDADPFNPARASRHINLLLRQKSKKTI
jgi:hypothetical protein